jgi:hypothetical protein
MKLLTATLMLLSFCLTLYAQITIDNFVTDDAKRAMDYITEDYIRANVQFLAHDLLEGRGTGSRGELLAATYIATQFKLFGLNLVGIMVHIFKKSRSLVLRHSQASL